MIHPIEAAIPQVNRLSLILRISRALLCDLKDVLGTCNRRFRQKIVKSVENIHSLEDIVDQAARVRVALLQDIRRSGRITTFIDAMR